MNPCQITVTKTDAEPRVLIERRNVAGTAISSSYRVDDDFAAVLHSVEHELREAFKVSRVGEQHTPDPPERGSEEHAERPEAPPESPGPCEDASSAEALTEAPSG